MIPLHRPVIITIESDYSMIRNVAFDIMDVLIDADHGPMHENVDLLMEVKSRGFPVYTVTNMSKPGFDRLKRDYPFLGLFDGVVVSDSVGLHKPDPSVFRHLLDQFGLSAEETLFIDDQQRNADGAAAAGLHAVRYENPRQLEAALIEHQVLVFDDDASTPACGRDCQCH